MPHSKGYAMMNLLLLFFCSHIQSLVELESVIVTTVSYFEYTAPLTYSLCWYANIGGFVYDKHSDCSMY